MLSTRRARIDRAHPYRPSAPARPGLCVAGLLLIVAAVLSASGRPQSEADRSASGERLLQQQTLVVGIMPAVDSIPLIVAEHLGYFAEEGVTVELELFRDQLYREASLQAGRIDAAVSDLVNTIRSWANGADYRAIASTNGLFGFVTSRSSGIATVADWPAAPGLVETGLIDDSIVNYTAERMLEAVGADPSRIRIVPTMQIPVRLELVISGGLQAAVLPEPLTRVAEAQGAYVIVESDVLESTPGVILATGDALRRKRDALRALLRAYDRAVAEVNADPDRFRDVIAGAAGFPAPVAPVMRIPVFAAATVPDPATVDDVSRWMVQRGLVSRIPERDTIVDPLVE
ncbi:MAG: ABC transporter substrate-binding protein [Spirochaetaceae bacterium]|nr:MAG: ABC transporter substrate-binding protein [Spirochaetaceae bacterium]